MNRSWLVLLIGLIACQKPDGFSIEEAKQLEEEGWKKLPDILARINPPTFANNETSVLDLGLKGDSVTNDRPALIEAIDQLSATGGGTLVFPEGQYFMEGPIVLQSNIRLHLEKDARIFFTSDVQHYLPLVKVRWEGTVCYNYSPLIYGQQIENIALTGSGVIDGAARAWSVDWRTRQKPDKKSLRQMGNDQIPEEQRVFGNGFLDLDNDGQDDGYGDGKQHFLRPTLLELYESRNILIEGLTFKDSPFWTIHPVFSKNITIRNLKVRGQVLNDDGIDPDSCEDVLIEGCNIVTHDDAISIKAGRDQDAWNRPKSQNIIVRNNQLLSGVNALCIGSEMSGGVENVFAENNHISGGKHALNFKCNLDRGGQVQKVYIRNTNIESIEEAMFIFRMDYHGYRGNNFPTKFNDFYVSGIKCGPVDQTPFKIVGVADQPISRVYLSDISIASQGSKSQLLFAEDILADKVYVGNEEITF